MTRDKAEELVTDLIYEYEAWNNAPSYLRRRYREDYMRFRELVIGHLITPSPQVTDTAHE